MGSSQHGIRSSSHKFNVQQRVRHQCPASSLRSTWQALCLGAGRMSPLPKLGGGRWNVTSVFGEILQQPGLPARREHLPGRKGGSVLLLMCTAPLLSSCWLGTKRQGPEQRDLYTAPSPRGLLGPVFFSSRAAGIQWAETLPPAPLWRHKRPFCTGAPEPLPRGGERPGLLQRADCVLGPRERAGPGQQPTQASLSPACLAARVGGEGLGRRA